MFISLYLFKEWSTAFFTREASFSMNFHMTIEIEFEDESFKTQMTYVWTSTVMDH